MEHAAAKVWMKKAKVVEVDEDDMDTTKFDELADESVQQAQEAQQPAAASILSFARLRRSSSASSAAARPAAMKRKVRWHEDDAQEAKKKDEPKKKVLRQAVDTSVVSIKLGTLSQGAKGLMTGDPTFCQNKNCQALFSAISEALDLKQAEKNPACSGLKLEDGQFGWVCEFCGTAQAVDFAPEEIPKADSVDYVLQPAETKASSEDESKLIFVIDTSGSMCVTKEVDGAVKIKGLGQRRDEFEALLEAGDDRQALQRHVKKTYISRLQCVQAAVDAQLEGLKTSHPKRRVGLVTFSNDCTLFGDCTEAPVTCAGDKLGDQARLAELGRNYEIKQTIGTSEPSLKKRLFELEEKGQTCLGPALLLGVNIAAQTRGSQVILCTDGLANIGLGALDGAAREAAEEFYEQLGTSAARDGVTVSTISITDQEASLENLGRVADATGGTVERIDPLKLTEQFKGILENPVIAVQTQATMLLHHGLQFRGVDVAATQESKTVGGKGEKSETATNAVHRLTKDVGNVFGDTELFYEYQFRPEFLEKRTKGLKTIPFQVQIKYTRLDGSKCIRVLSQTREVTTDETEAVLDMDHALLAANAMQRSAALAQAGDYEGSRVNNVAWSHFMSNSPSKTPQRQTEVIRKWRADAGQLDSLMQQEQQREASEGSSTQLRAMTGVAKKSARSSRRSDGIAAVMYRSNKSNSANY
eukprot:gb/GEZN01000350.1/.p1 GENE.gb/GEZN01000350.1/~~gb/GEZN01000350.1/.p1  ORF type:complete len:700 (-),score=146.51 gb/GEZN01000350.1/:2574-4673(-)